MRIEFLSSGLFLESKDMRAIFWKRTKKKREKKAKSLKIWGKCIKFENVLKKWLVIGYDNRRQSARKDSGLNSL